MKKSLFLATSLLASAFTANAALSTTDFKSNDYVAEWGRLKLNGNQLSSASGEAIQLKGFSTFSINYDEVNGCLSDAGFDAMKAWGANIVRLAVYPKNSKGSYSAATLAQVKNYINACADRGMYCLVDWHVLDGDQNSGNPATYKSQAKEFFQGVAAHVKNMNYKHVLYEICNECSGVSWGDIKNYASEVLPIISSGDPGAIVIVGTPQWDQNVMDAVNSPISRTQYDLGIMYAFHYYACSHGHFLGTFSGACASLPMFISEWGAVNFDGDQQKLGESDFVLCTKESNTFLSYLNRGNQGKQLVSWCYWAWGWKDEASNAIKASNRCTTFDQDALSSSGKYIVPVLNGGQKIAELPKPRAMKIQKIPETGENYGILNVGFFDWGGEGIAYHDANSSMYCKDGDGVIDRTCLATTGDEVKCCNAGAGYASMDCDVAFRADTECVDVSNSTAGMGANWGDPGDGYLYSGADLHNLCSTEGGEWINYTIDVKKKGYYTVDVLTTSNTSTTGGIGFVITTMDKPNQQGNIVRSWKNHDDEEALNEEPWVSVVLNPCTECGEGSSTSALPAWECWNWMPAGKGREQQDLTVLFKYEGEQTLQLLISPEDPTATPGDFSNIKFTFKSADIPEFEYTEAEQVEASLEGVAIYPNPTNGDFTVKVGQAANVSIYSATGAMVYNQNVEGDVVVNNNFAAGIYTVRVATATGVKSMKLVVK